MARKREPVKKKDSAPVHYSQRKAFHMEFKNTPQKIAWTAFEQHDVLFLLGPAGVGKSHLATAFAISEIINRKKSKIVLTRPIVEAGESLGFLPGDMGEKVNPYMMPLWDCITKMVGPEGPERERVNRAIEVAPLAFMRGRTFSDAVCIFDEAQNASLQQIKLFLTRFDTNTKLIITGDPDQSDLRGPVALVDVVDKLESEPGIGVIKFNNSSIVRHPLIGRILEKLG